MASVFGPGCGMAAADGAQARELRVLEPRDHAEDPCLFGVFHFGLEAHNIIERGEFVILT